MNGVPEAMAKHVIVLLHRQSTVAVQFREHIRDTIASVYPAKSGYSAVLQQLAQSVQIQGQRAIAWSRVGWRDQSFVQIVAVCAVNNRNELATIDIYQGQSLDVRVFDLVQP